MNDESRKSPETPLRRAIRIGAAAAWRNRLPAFCLWLFGMGLIGGYYLLSPVHDGLETLRNWKSESGILFAAVSTGLFAGAIPVAMSRLAGRPTPTRFRLYLIGNVVFWAVKGIEIEFFYLLQALWFGDNSSAVTIGLKVFVDQLFYAPFLGLLNVVLFYRWRESGYSWAAFADGLNLRWVRDDFLPVLISNWMVWIPACALIYCLPQGLQLPIQNLILCFWVLILMFFTESEPGPVGERDLTGAPANS